MGIGIDDNAVRPFRVDVPEEALVDLRRRVLATRWPDRETVNDQSQGIQLGKLKPLVEYWGTGYDWRRTEAKLNALPQFLTRIDGLDIHFIHVEGDPCVQKSTTIAGAFWELPPWLPPPPSSATSVLLKPNPAR
jgi:epoxide hydrolase-like protein